MKIFLTVLKLLSGHDFYRKNFKGALLHKMLVELKFLFSAHRLLIVYICTKYHENILNGMEVIERT